MITIKNTQRTIPINEKKLQKTIHKILDNVGYPNCDIGVWITTNRSIQKYNKKYRAKNKPTDILSFMYHPSLKPGQAIVIKTPDDANLGDLIISAEYVKHAAEQFEISFDQHLYIIIIHGICHLLGYTHESDAAHKKMTALEAQLATLIT